ncbi:MAG TPA: DUF177 domain-containing protein [Desulfobulbus sp.]|nr:DUF177 domain-containing protein [Desulfobulbus sp.]
MIYRFAPYGAGETLKVRFSEISSSGSRYELSEIPAPETGGDFSLRAPAQATCVLTRKSATRVVLQGRLQAEMILVCDRCTVEYCFPVDREVQLILEVPDASHWQLREIEYSRDDLDIVPLREPVIHLDDLFRQHLYLALPVKRLCRTGCRGICPCCGVDLNIETCRCTQVPVSSPFAVLAALKKK